ncbi:MAG: hypothetical protein JW763_09100 [candidate division Zixibacteria bacterium]|nr:hypothetical protein [candidate division Zixibacteria bacterium]
MGEPRQIARYIGDIFSEMLKEFKPGYEEEEILSLIDFIYTNNLKTLANEICEKYIDGEDGYHFIFVKDIWDKYNA